MNKFLNSQKQGIILLIIAAFIWVPLPKILPWNTIAALGIIGLGLYNLLLNN